MSLCFAHQAAWLPRWHQPSWPFGTMMSAPFVMSITWRAPRHISASRDLGDLTGSCTQTHFTRTVKHPAGIVHRCCRTLEDVKCSSCLKLDWTSSTAQAAPPKITHCLAVLQAQAAHLPCKIKQRYRHWPLTLPACTVWLHCRYKQQHERHGELLQRFAQNMELLASITLHEGAGTDRIKRLIDMVPEQRLREWAENCRRSHEQFTDKVYGSWRAASSASTSHNDA